MSQAGNAYTTFDLVDGKEKLHVFLANKLEKPPEEGDKVDGDGAVREGEEGRPAGLQERDRRLDRRSIRLFGVKKGWK